MATTTRGSISQNITLIGIFLIFAGVALSYQFFIPSLKKSRQALTALKAQEKGINQDITDLGKVNAQLTNGKKQLESEGITFDQIDNVVPLTENVPQLYIQMEHLMRDPNIQVPAYTLSTPVKQADGSVNIAVTVQAYGTYAGIKAFIANLEHNERPISLTSIAISIRGSSGASDSVGGKPKIAPDSPLSVQLGGIVLARSLSPSYAVSAK
jgi:Tfp pilus assembly protein PilO